VQEKHGKWEPSNVPTAGALISASDGPSGDEIGLEEHNPESNSPSRGIEQVFPPCCYHYLDLFPTSSCLTAFLNAVMPVYQPLNVFVYSQVAGTLAVAPSDVPCCGRPAEASRDDAFVPMRDTTDIAAEAHDGEGHMGTLLSESQALLNVTKLMTQKASRVKANREQRAAHRSANEAEGAAKVCSPCTLARRPCTCASKLSQHATKNRYLTIICA
jgi:hypothetical protein